MNILGISGAIGWDGNIPYLLDNLDLWVHGAGATLIMNGELKNAISEERFSRIKYDGNYPKLAIQNILEYNKLTKYDIDLVVYVGGAPYISLPLKQVGYIETKLKEFFPNCKVDFLNHHMAHTAATFFTSGFDEANILSFDGAGDLELRKNGERWLSHMKFSCGKDLILTNLHTEYIDIFPMANSFGNLYAWYSMLVYKNKMNLPVNDITELLTSDRESYAGKVMGLSAYGDHRNIDLPEWFSLEREKQQYSNEEWEDCFPQLHHTPLFPSGWSDVQDMDMSPDDLAAWLQHQFEKHLLNWLSNIPENIKSDNLCLGGGSALNILTNSKIIEQGIYKNVHVNTAPNDDGLHFGAAIFGSAKQEGKVILPEDIGYLGITYTDEEIEEVL